MNFIIDDEHGNELIHCIQNVKIEPKEQAQNIANRLGEVVILYDPNNLSNEEKFYPKVS